MSDTPGEHLTEEPQSERGPMGSRATPARRVGGGRADRPRRPWVEGFGDLSIPGAAEG